MDLLQSLKFIVGILRHLSSKMLLSSDATPKMRIITQVGVFKNTFFCNCRAALELKSARGTFVSLLIMPIIRQL
jgi:hypothetical protein